MSTYTLTPTEYRNLKSALTRAVNSKDSQKIIAACDKAMAIFEEKGYPDDWSRWQRAKEDAEMAQRYARDR